MSEIGKEDMRAYVRLAYKGDDWHKKVDNMPDNQVIAIYHSIKERKKLKMSRKMFMQRKEASGQVSIFDYMGVKHNEKKIFNKLV